MTLRVFSHGWSLGADVFEVQMFFLGGLPHTRHAWRNQGNKPAKLVFVFVGAKRGRETLGNRVPVDSFE